MLLLIKSKYNFELEVMQDSTYFPSIFLLLYCRVDDMLVDSGTEKKRRKEDGMYESILTWRVPRVQVDPPVTFNCALSIPGTNYTARRETIYYSE